MKPPLKRLPPMRHFQLVEINGSRVTVVSRHSTRWEANQAKKRLEGTMAGRLKVREAWA